jgi:hypothetical protein
MARFGSSGRRTEHILYCHRRVEALYSPREATVLIRKRRLQKGVALSYKSYFYDELVFKLWAVPSRSRPGPRVTVDPMD